MGCKKRRPYKTGYSKGFCRFNKPTEPLKNIKNLKLTEKRQLRECKLGI